MPPKVCRLHWYYPVKIIKMPALTYKKGVSPKQNSKIQTPHPIIINLKTNCICSVLGVAHRIQTEYVKGEVKPINPVLSFENLETSGNNYS
jgi:hypothetical protein